MEGEEEIRRYLTDTIGEEGCGGACSEADISWGEEGWTLKMCGFMEPWKLGRTTEEAKENIKSDLCLPRIWSDLMLINKWLLTRICGSFVV